MISRLRIICNSITAFCLILTGSICLWHVFDSREDYQTIVNETKQIRKKKPAQAESVLTDLQEINPDIIAWITLDGTAIDQPVLQGETNYTYLHQNMNGEYSLSGSLFMDIRCDSLFQEGYQLIYGHHMTSHMMLADLDLYLEESFFRQYHHGILFLEEGEMDLESLAILKVKSDDPWIFDPRRCNEDSASFLHYIRDTRLYQREDLMDLLSDNPDNMHLIALSTCSQKAEDERIVMILCAEGQNS